MLGNKILIEIRKAGFLNKGAELMLYAVLEKMKAAYPDAKFAMEPYRLSAPYEKRALLGFYQKPRLFIMGIQFGQLFNLVPGIIKDRLGIVTDKDVDIVIDAAGFLYSDQWDVRSSLELSDSCKRWNKNGTKVILLPQAFGPFKNSNIRKAIKVALNNADLVFAREKVSYDYLVDVAGERPNLKMAPDFTNLIDGVLPDEFDAQTNRFCLVPNYRMIDKTPKEQSEAYLPFMINCAKYLVKKNAKPFILVHEGANDLMLAEQINKAVGGVLSIIKETHPLKIKGILGVCEGTLGSRFHGLVSALSQGVPALATGWSHKYQILFDDYGFSEGLLDVTSNEQELHTKLDLLINEDSKARIKQTISQSSASLKEQSKAMWDDVFATLNK